MLAPSSTGDSGSSKTLTVMDRPPTYEDLSKTVMFMGISERAANCCRCQAVEAPAAPAPIMHLAYYCVMWAYQRAQRVGHKLQNCEHI